MVKLGRVLGGMMLAATATALFSGDTPVRTGVRPASVERPKKDPPKREPVKALQTPDEAVRLALADLKSLPWQHHSYVRYLWVQDGSKESTRTSSLTLNYVSRASSIVRPFPVAGGHLLRVDLSFYAPRYQDLKEWLALWEQLAFDPTFSLLITKDNLEFAAKAAFLSKETVHRERVERVRVPGKKRVKSEQVYHKGGDYKYPDGSGRVGRNVPAGQYTVELWFYDEDTFKEVVVPYDEVVTVKRIKDVAVLRFNPDHIDANAFEELQYLTCSEAPIVEHRYFKFRALNSIQELNPVYQAVLGGLYYELRGVREAKKVLGNGTKATDLDLFLEDLGIGNIKAGLTADKLFDRLRSDQRLAMNRSLVTGKPREISAFNTPAGKEISAWGSITGDIADEQIDIGDVPTANLLNPRRAAREAIFPGATGLSKFALFDGKGKLQREVPQFIAIDTTIPAPHTRRLQCAIGCIRCHGTDGSDGWKPAHNDVTDYVGRDKADIFDDLTDPHRHPREGAHPRAGTDVIDRLVGLYGGDFDGNLRLARDLVARATLRACGPFEGSKEAQADIAKLAAVRLSDEYREWWYDPVDARRALAEVGLSVPKGQSVAYLKALLPPDTRSTTHDGVVPEDPTLVALKAGKEVNRFQWMFAFPYAAERMKTTLRNHQRIHP